MDNTNQYCETTVAQPFPVDDATVLPPGGPDA